MVRHAVPNNAREGRRNLGDQLRHSGASPFDVALVHWYVLVLAKSLARMAPFEEAFSFSRTCYEDFCLVQDLSTEGKGEEFLCSKVVA